MSYINTDTLEYPLTEQQVIAQAFPSNTTPARPFVAPEPFAWVFPTPAPEHNPITHYVQQAAPVLSNKGTWETGWEVVAYDTEIAQTNLEAAVAQAREQAHARINAEYAALTAQLAAGYPPTEQQSWPIQIQEAKIVLSGDTETPTPWIDAAAATREVTRTDLATLISNQDTAYRQYHGTLTGIRQKLRDEIEAVPNDDINSISILNNINWPEE